MSHGYSSFRSRNALILVSMSVLIVALALLRRPSEDQSPLSSPAPSPTAPSSTASSARQPVTDSSSSHLPDQVPLRPLAVVRASATHEWTAEDAMDPQVIEKIVHNQDEFLRMAEENERIERRQLVYRKETVPMLLDRARATGQPLKSITLPGLDGKEVEVEVLETRMGGMPNSGCVIGHVKGHQNSLASVGFSNGCEMFTIMSPDEGLYLMADAREPGEVIVKEFIPAKYSPSQKCEPILTQQSAPDALRSR